MTNYIDYIYKLEIGIYGWFAGPFGIRPLPAMQKVSNYIESKVRNRVQGVVEGVTLRARVGGPDLEREFR